MGCKRHACEVNRDKKLKQLIIDGADSVKFLNGMRPRAHLTFDTQNEEGITTSCFTVENSCHNILHDFIYR